MQIPLSGLGVSPGYLAYTIISNNNPTLVQAEIVDEVLRLSFVAGRQGSATILLRLMGPGGESSLSVTVTAIRGVEG